MKIKDHNDGHRSHTEEAGTLTAILVVDSLNHFVKVLTEQQQTAMKNNSPFRCSSPQ